MHISMTAHLAKRVPECCLCVRLTCGGKNLWWETWLDEGNRRTRSMCPFQFSSLLKEKTHAWRKRSLIGSCDPLSHVHTAAMICALTYVHTPTHAVSVVHQRRGKQRHLGSGPLGGVDMICGGSLRFSRNFMWRSVLRGDFAVRSLRQLMAPKRFGERPERTRV